MNNTIKIFFTAILAASFSSAYGYGGFVKDGSGMIVVDGANDCVIFGKHHTGKMAKNCGKPAPKKVAKPAPPPAPKPVVHETVTLGAAALFDHDKSAIKPAARSALDELAAKLKAFFSIDAVSVVGHTDSQGTAKYNQGLSERRANSVKSYLVNKGIDGDKIYATGAGESQPVADNKTKEGRAKNRRVEIDIRARQ
jgi:OOP family OmpA-OmpF porin